jgi:hypothetical protein
MRAFLSRVEFHRLTGIQRPFHADIGMHQRPSIFRGHDDGFCCSFSFRMNAAASLSVTIGLPLFGIGSTKRRDQDI